MSEANATTQKERVNKTNQKPAMTGSLQRKVAVSQHFGQNLTHNGKQDESAFRNGQSLQRTCSCGKHTIGGGECTACRQGRLGGSAEEKDKLKAGGERLKAPGLQRFQPEFSQVQTSPATFLRTIDQTGGGEGAGDDDRDTIVGAETTIFPLTVSQWPGQSIQRQEEGGTVKLNYTTITAPYSLGCGGFRSQVRWGLDGANDKTNGFVVQKVTFDLQREKCEEGDSNYATTYWEAWQVRNGKIYIGLSESPHGSDTFQVPAAEGHKGSCYEAGWAKFMPDYEAPKSWGNVPEALSLPSTKSKPEGWSDAGTLHRWMRNTFDCCGQSDMGKFESKG